MGFPLASVVRAAPGLISAATDIIGMIRKSRGHSVQVDVARFDELSNLVEHQARVIEELALNNRDLVLAVRNNRIFSIAALTIAACALLLAMLH